MIADFSQHKSKISINFSVYAYMSKKLRMESTTFRARIMNYNPLAYIATMYFERQTDFGRLVKSSCITMSLFKVMYIHFSCNVNKWLSLNTISLNIFDRVPVLQPGVCLVGNPENRISHDAAQFEQEKNLCRVRFSARLEFSL